MNSIRPAVFGLLCMLAATALAAQDGPAPVKVRVLEAEISEAYTAVMYGARVEPADRFSIRSPITGTLVSYAVREGSPVQPGDVVFTVRRELSGRTYQAVEVQTPYNGRVTMLDVREGDPVTENLPVLTVIDDSSYSMTLFISDRDIQAVGTGDRLLLFSDGEILPVRGTVSARALEPDYSTGLFEVELSVPRHRSIVIGRFLKAELRKDIHRGVVVESEYLDRRYGGLYLPVLKTDSTVEMREVVPLRVYGRRTALAGGLAAGETYIIWSEQRLQDGTPAEVVP